MARELKQIVSKQLKSALGSLDGCVLVDYRGLNSEKTQDLRVSLRKTGIRMAVVPNRLVRRVFEESGAPAEFRKAIRGPTAVLFGSEGAIAASKAIVQWRKKNKDLAAIKGGFFLGKSLGSGDVEHLATIPDAATLRSVAACLLMAPLSYLPSAIQSLVGHFAGSVQSHRESLEKGQGGGA
jgi:ribosomal protein L10